MMKISKNHIRYTHRKAIKYDGKLVGWRLYVKGVNGIPLSTPESLRFVGYEWKAQA